MSGSRRQNSKCLMFSLSKSICFQSILPDYFPLFFVGLIENVCLKGPSKKQNIRRDGPFKKATELFEPKLFPSVFFDNVLHKLL